MRNTIREFIEPSNTDKRQLWEKAVFIFDTNVLLNLYRYSAKTRNSLLGAFESLKERVWIPYQVAYEFMRRRCEVIYETVQRYTQFEKEIQAFTQKTTDILRLTPTDEEFSELNRFLIKWLNSNKEQNLLVQNATKDEILEKILMIFNERVGSNIDESELKHIIEEGKERYAKSIPPGYRDKKKAKEELEDNNAYGDLIIWKQILKYAKDHQVGIIYVTHDQKEDWWNIIKGKTIGPRVELRREFMDQTQQEFHMYSMHTFISTYNEINKNLIDKSVVDEVISLDKVSKKKKKVSYSLSEQVLRAEETLGKIQSRIVRRQQIIKNIEDKYQKQGIDLPENIQTQYDNTKAKIEELEIVYTRKQQELAELKGFDIGSQVVIP